MAAVLLQFIRQVDDANGFEGAFLDAYPTSAAKFLRYDNFIFFEPDSFNSATDHGAIFYANLVAFLRLAFVGVHYCNAGHDCSGI
jgi:hypothetical protein